MKTKIHIVLPAYNEEASLPHLLKRLDFALQDSNLHGEIIIVNDGSTDNTAEIARTFRCDTADQTYRPATEPRIG
jgi:glycosyltransferase involved in cell wall biosynthesis